MKNINLLVFIAIIIIAGCMQTSQTKRIDQKAIYEDIMHQSDKYKNAWNSKNITELAGLTSDNGTFFGSDPSEVLNKNLLIKMFTDLFTDTTTDYGYTVDLRRVKIAPDGESALVIEHISMSKWSPLLKMSQSFQFVKNNNSWKIEYINWGFLINNEDVEKLNNALEE